MDSCVAVCTLDSDDIKLPEDKIALRGMCKTENLGVESIVRAVIKNSSIRFLILCGKEPDKRFSGLAIKSLHQNGTDESGRIIGAKGLMPFIKNLSSEEIEYFRKQVKIIDMIGNSDASEIEMEIDKCNAENPGAYGEPPPKEKETMIIKADYDADAGWTADDKSDENWFIIGIDRPAGKIFAEHHIGYGKDMRKCCKIVGETVESIMGTLVKKGKVTKLYHAAYLGKELQKAEIAMKKGIEYNQELHFDI